MIAISDIKQWLETTNEAVLSLYLVVDPSQMENQAATPAWQIWAKNALKQIESDLQTSQAEVWSEIQLRLENFLPSYTPSGKTLILFLGKSLHQVYELSVLLENYAAFGEPALTPLIHAIHQHKPYLIVQLDHESARIWLVALNRIEHEEQMQLEVHREEWPQMRLKPSPALSEYVKAGSNRDRYLHRVEEQLEHFQRKVAKQIVKLSRNYDTEYVVLAGDPEANHSLHHFLPHQTVIGPIPVAHYLSSSEVLKEASRFVTEYEHSQELTLVEEAIQIAKSGGRYALGTNVLKALEQHCVEMLIVPHSPANDRLVDKLTLEGLKAGADVRPVGSEAAKRLIAECGIAARLYYGQSA